MSRTPALPPIAGDAARLAAEIAALAEFNAAQPPAVTRVVYSAEDRAARAYVIDRCREAGLAVRTDPLGNTFARWLGARPDLPVVATGSHIDAIPGAGRFDGTVGVLGAIEAVRALRRAGWQPERSIEVILFTSEEPTRFGVGCLGSRALAGVLDASALAALRDGAGQSLDALRAEAGFAGPLDAVRLDPGHYAAFVELHIEQGPVLEERGYPIGVVEAIAAPATLRITLDGEGGHAGTVLMPQRRDALCGMAEVILAVEVIAAGSISADAVATVGTCRVEPGAVNGIPSRVVVEVDLRDIDLAPRDAMLAEIRQAVRRTAEHRELSATVDLLNADPPARSDPAVVAAIAATCQAAGVPVLPMVSRAYHDALFLSQIAPTAMIFVPSRGGYSHRPEEYTPPDQIAQGVAVLAGTLARLSLAASPEHSITS